MRRILPVGTRPGKAERMPFVCIYVEIGRSGGNFLTEMKFGLQSGILQF